MVEDEEEEEMLSLCLLLSSIHDTISVLALLSLWWRGEKKEKPVSLI